MDPEVHQIKMRLFSLVAKYSCDRRLKRLRNFAENVQERDV
jgi:hypothetical protein